MARKKVKVEPKGSKVVIPGNFDDKIPDAMPKNPSKPKWVPICKIGSAYDFDEEKGIYSESMSKVEIQQEVHSKVVRAVIIKD